MEGLEISILKFKKVFDNDFGRIDSEFFKIEYINREKILLEKKSVKISEISNVTDGEHGSPDLDESSGILYLSGNNIKENRIDFEKVRFCSSKLHKKNLRSSLKKGNVLMSIVGTVGKCSIVYDNILANTDRNVATIKNIKSIVNPYFLSVFLNSSYGYFQSQRFSTGNVQPLLNLLQVKSIIVPILYNSFQIQIQKTLILADNYIKQSHLAYTQAENLLLATLDLQDFKPSTEKVNVRSFKESFLATGRLDAEYYQKKYEDVISCIKDQKHEILGNLVSINKSIEPGSDAYKTEGIPFIRISNITKFGITDTDIKLNPIDFDVSKLSPKKDTILLSKDGSVGIAYKVEQDLEAITSSALIHLRVIDNRILPDYLTLVLNSKLTQMQAERDAGGSIIQHWRTDEIKNVLIPIIPLDVQEEISSLVKNSYQHKKQSEKLLELAKRAVEIAIEGGEEAGMRLINEHLAN